MQILFNELSLSGQFSNQDAFIRKALFPILGVLKEMRGFSTLLLKKSDVWDKMVTPERNLHSILVELRKSDEVLRFKSAIASLTKEPFWDDDSMQEPYSTYFLNGNDIKGSSAAEACERDKIVVSFILSPTSVDPLNVIKNELNIPLKNLTYPGELTELLWSTNQISFESYLKARFSKGKLDFSRENLDFSILQSDEQDLCVDTFRKFEEMTWHQIHTNKGLDYKEYHGTVNIFRLNRKTYKFRASKKIRCHGYRDNDSFIVICFETDHKLSDRG